MQSKVHLLTNGAQQAQVSSSIDPSSFRTERGIAA